MIEIGATHHEIAPDLHLIPECDERSDRVRDRTDDTSLPDSYPAWEDVEWHGRNNAYLFDGEETFLFENLSPLGREILHEALDELLDGRELDYAAISHTDQPHCGNTQSVLERYPDCTLLAPEYGQPDELYYLGDGEPVSVGDTLALDRFEFEFLEAFFLDAAKSIWLFERTTGTLFTADWLMFPHTSEECLECTDEMDRDLSVEHLWRAHNGNFSWWRISDVDAMCDDIDYVLDTWAPTNVAPTHGNTIRNEDEVRRYFDRMKEVVELMNARQRAAVEGTA